MSTAVMAAEEANTEVVRLSLTIQTLLDAAKRGQAITEHDLHILHVDCGVLRVAVARAFHAVSHSAHSRRAEEIA
jgi:hypothetical protein